MKQMAEKILKRNPAIISSLLKGKKISKRTERVLRGFLQYGYFSPMTTGGYGFSDELSELIIKEATHL